MVGHCDAEVAVGLHVAADLEDLFPVAAHGGLRKKMVGRTGQGACDTPRVALSVALRIWKASVDP